jgi:hypothetical protein
MADFTASRPGQANGTGATDALFFKVFPGEILKFYNAANVMMGRHLVRSISSGKSASFPVTGWANASYHVPGTQLIGTAGGPIKHAEKIINIDSLLVSDVFVANIDEAMNHFEVRGEYARQIGEALALKGDKQQLQVAILAARSAANITGGPGGSALTNATAGTDGEVLASMIFDANRLMDEKNVAGTERQVVVKPAQYYLLAQTTKVINKDWGGSGVYADGSIYRVAGSEIVKSNNVPSTNIASAETGVNNTYHGDFSKSVAVVFHKAAIGTVKLLDLATEKDYLISYQGTLMVGKYAMGHGILRPECAVEIATP